MEGNDINNQANTADSGSNSNNNGKERQTLTSDNSFIDMKFLRIFIVIDRNKQLTDSVSFLINSKDTVKHAIKEAVLQYNQKLFKQKAKFFINKNHQNYTLMYSLSRGLPDLSREGPNEDKEITSFEENEFTLVWKDDPSNFNIYIKSPSDKQLCQDGCVVS